MSEKKAAGKQKKPGANRLTHPQFFRACMALQSMKEQFLAERPTYVVATKQLNNMLDFKISPYTLTEMRAETGVDWEPKHSKTASAAGHSNERYRFYRRLAVVAREMRRVERELGMEIPDDLAVIGTQDDEALPAAPEQPPEATKAPLMIDKENVEQVKSTAGKVVDHVFSRNGGNRLNMPVVNPLNG